MRPAIKKYGLRHVRNKEALEGPHIYAKDLTPEKIKELAKGNAFDTVNRFKQDGKDILYTVAAMFSLFDGYDSEKGKKEPKS